MDFALRLATSCMLGILWADVCVYISGDPKYWNTPVWIALFIGSIAVGALWNSAYTAISKRWTSSS